jgi:hypothetical protein
MVCRFGVDLFAVQDWQERQNFLGSHLQPVRMASQSLVFVRFPPTRSMSYRATVFNFCDKSFSSWSSASAVRGEERCPRATLLTMDGLTPSCRAILAYTPLKSETIFSFVIASLCQCALAETVQ